MPNKSWTVNFEDGRHLIEFSRSNFTGQRLIKVDGREVYKKFSGVEIGSQLPFYIGSHPCAVICETNGFYSTFELKTDYIAAPPKIMPGWGWFFVVACGIIPFISIGGAITTAIGAGGGVFCYWVAKGTYWSTTKKVIACVAITAISWVLFFGFVSVVTHHR